MRALAFVCVGLALAGCKKHPKAEDEPAPAGSAHHNTTGHAQLKGDTPESGSAASGSSAEALDAGVDADKTKKPAYRDDDGHLHGPGGPIFMGNAAFKCDREHDHCLRPQVWFQIHAIETGGAYRATPVFTFESKWWTWAEGDPAETDGQLYKTKPAEGMPTPGTKLVYFHGDPEDGSLLPETEMEALTASSWQAGVVEKVQGTTITISGVGDIPLDEARVITETRGF